MTSARGRPLRFLVVVTISWVAMRVAWLWPHGVPPERWVRIMLPTGQGAAVGQSVAAIAAPFATHRHKRARPAVVRAIAAPMAFAARTAERDGTPVAADSDRMRLALLGLVGFASVEPVDRSAAPILSPPLPPLSGPPVTVSVWALARPGSATGGPVQLGGGQAGMRVRVPVTPGGRAALAARIATPLAGQGQEAALGVEWRPLRAPVALVVERRVALDTSRSGTGMGLIAGIDRRLPANVALEAYGQAGAVARDGIEPYADGAARLLHPVATTGRATVRLGIGGWGAAQREGARIDVGPSVVAAVPVGRAVRYACRSTGGNGSAAAPRRDRDRR